MEIVGEYLSIDTEKGLYAYFRNHYAEWFPALPRVHRTTFTRQMANLWVAKERLWRYLLLRISFDPRISLVDSFPVPTCRFARACRCRLLPEESAFGYDEMAKQTFYGMRAHLRVCWPGVIVGVGLWPPPMPTTCAWPRNCSRTRRVGRWGTGTIGVPTSPSGSGTRGCVYLPLTSPRRKKRRDGHAGWCKSGAG
jgi:hypothetical protein